MMAMSLTRPRRGRRGVLGAFTLVEMLITLGAGLLIALALASMFQTAGETVSSGERLSRFSRAASLIERQMRDDFSSITRDGFMVIRHEITHDGDGGLAGDGGWGDPVKVPLTPDDLNPRFRRTDEIVFFRKGRFSSARQALAPGMTASGNEARIYYGHGARMDPLTNDPVVRIPAYDLGVSDGAPSPVDTVGRLGDPDGPNRFAANWTLLRQVTVLAPPATALGTFPDSGDFFGIDDETAIRDAERQIGLQPAMPSVFRQENIAWVNDAPASSTHLREGGGDGYQRDEPLYLSASGLLDVATIDLNEVRARVTSSHLLINPGSVPSPGDLIRPGGLLDISDIPETRPATWHPLLDLDQPNDVAYLSNMQAWMRQALPADTAAEDSLRELWGVRVRSEPVPPGVADILNDTGTYDPEELETADRLNDQLMLVASNLALRCTEFKIEWSFGQAFTTGERAGELIWYGGDVRDDNNAQMFRYSGNGAFPLRLDVRTGESLPVLFGPDLPPTNEFHIVDDRLIHGSQIADVLGYGVPGQAIQVFPAPTLAPNADTTVLYSYFGYNDPAYDETTKIPAALDEMPWAWPKLLRVSVTLVDENDPELEQAFQWVFEVGEGE